MYPGIMIVAGVVCIMGLALKWLLDDMAVIEERQVNKIEDRANSMRSENADATICRKNKRG